MFPYCSSMEVDSTPFQAGAGSIARIVFNTGPCPLHDLRQTMTQDSEILSASQERPVDFEHVETLYGLKFINTHGIDADGTHFFKRNAVTRYTEASATSFTDCLML